MNNCCLSRIWFVNRLKRSQIKHKHQHVYHSDVQLLTHIEHFFFSIGHFAIFQVGWIFYGINYYSIFLLWHSNLESSLNTLNQIFWTNISVHLLNSMILIKLIAVQLLLVGLRILKLKNPQLRLFSVFSLSGIIDSKFNGGERFAGISNRLCWIQSIIQIKINRASWLSTWSNDVKSLINTFILRELKKCSLSLVRWKKNICQEKKRRIHSIWVFSVEIFI